MQPYRWVAQFYDQLHGADAVNRNRVARYKALARILPQVRSVCDLGCGTGSTAIEFARQGFRVYAVDLSPTMCRLARQKARRARVRVRVLCADLRRFRLPQPVDLVTCEFNPLNHLPRKTDLVPALRAVARALKPGGWFFFDVNTRRTFEKYYQQTFFFTKPQFYLVMHGRYDRRRHRGSLQFEWFLRRGRWFRHQRERVEDVWWTNGEIRRALRAAGFRQIRGWDGVDLRPPEPGARRGFDAYFLARKSAAR